MAEAVPKPGAALAAAPAPEFTPAEEAVLRDETAPPETSAAEPAAEPSRETSEPAAADAPGVPSDTPTPAQAVEPGPPGDKPAAPLAGERTVPLAVLLEEREKRQARDRDFAVLADRLDRLTRAQQELARPKEPQPEPDPIARLQTLEQREQYRQQAAEEHQQRQQIYSIAAQHENQFVAAQPDYREAVTFLAEQRGRELELQGMTNPAQRQAQLQNDWLSLAYNAATSGRNTAEVAYQLAKARGWAPKPPPQAAGANGAAKPGVPSGTAAAEIAAQRQAALQRGAAAAQSLSSSGAAAARTGTSLESLLEMSEKEFDEATVDMDKFRKMFGE